MTENYQSPCYKQLCSSLSMLLPSLFTQCSITEDSTRYHGDVAIAAEGSYSMTERSEACFPLERDMSI